MPDVTSLVLDREELLSRRADLLSELADVQDCLRPLKIKAPSPLNELAVGERVSIDRVIKVMEDELEVMAGTPLAALWYDLIDTLTEDDEAVA